MLQRDYIQRLIREFMAALERMLEKKEVEKIIKKLVKEGKVESPKRCYYAAVK